MESESKTPQVLLQLLCTRTTGLHDDAVLPYYKMAVNTISSSMSTPRESGEFEVTEKIKRKLVRQGKQDKAVYFSQLHRKLQANEAVLKQRWAVLYLLHRLSDSNKDKTGAGASFLRGFAKHATSTPMVGRTPLPRHPGGGANGGGASETRGMTSLHSVSSVTSHGSSGISSIHGSLDSREPTPQTLLPSTFAQTPYIAQHRGGAHLPSAPPSTGARLANTLRRYHEDSTFSRDLTSRDASSRGVTSRDVTMRSERGYMGAGAVRQSPQGENTSHELPEVVLVRELIYVLQGIEGQHIKYDKLRELYKIDPQIGVPNSRRHLVSKLAECGWLYNKIRRYGDSRSTDRAFGLVGQSFCSALHQELTEYHRLMSVLESQLRLEEDQGISMAGTGLTLKKLSVWLSDPLVKLKAIACLVDVCQGKKGGALASAIHSHMQHGDPYIRALIKHTLAQVAQPIFTTVTRWIYDGELDDNYHEFLVASDPTVKDDKLWHDKYHIRKGMVPSFLTEQQANKILLTGKSINFLRQVCHDRTTIRTRDVVKAAETSQVETIFEQDVGGLFQKMIDTVYQETSSHLIEVLHTKYKFMDHLKAMRRYLLLGQGDFIRHLMDLMEEDLAKPANQVFLHNLTGILETAIRATNAQFDDPDILKRLDVRLLELSPGDIGWDVFSLDYHVEGPISTVFTPQCITIYLREFNFLWRAKRMEYILAGIWKGQMSNSRMLKAIPELAAVFHQCHITASEMVHFVQQVQYYINFEVLECSWDELLKQVQEARDLDHIIAAHQIFLDTIVTRSLLDKSSSAILTQLRTIFDLIIQFQSIQDNMYQSANEELILRQMYEDCKKKKTQEGAWGVTEAEEETEQSRRKKFRHTLIPETRSKLRVLAASYQKMVGQFLVMLNGHSDASLRFLSFRLDFNEHYRAKEPSLRSSYSGQRAKRASVDRP